MGKKTENKVGQVIFDRGLEGLNRFYGIYRGLVVSNDDATGSNRLLVWVPEVMGGIRRWAYPRGQQGGYNYGFKQLTPKINEVVYISFEYGDASKPLWEPHGWSEGEGSGLLKDPAIGGFITPNGNMFLYNEHNNTLHINFKGSVFIHSAENIVLSSDNILTLKSGNGVVVNEGSNGGMVNSPDLTLKLNQLIQELETQKQQLNACITLLNTHTHNCTAPGSPSGPNLMQMQTISQTFTQFNSLDYEDEKALH